jgi:hypothetical protein
LIPDAYPLGGALERLRNFLHCVEAVFGAQIDFENKLHDMVSALNLLLLRDDLPLNGSREEVSNKLHRFVVCRDLTLKLSSFDSLQEFLE